MPRQYLPIPVSSSEHRFHNVPDNRNLARPLRGQQVRQT